MLVYVFQKMIIFWDFYARCLLNLPWMVQTSTSSRQTGSIWQEGLGKLNKYSLQLWKIEKNFRMHQITTFEEDELQKQKIILASIPINQEQYEGEDRQGLIRYGQKTQQRSGIWTPYFMVSGADSKNYHISI